MAVRGPQILVILGSFAAGALGFFGMLELGYLPLLPGERFADRRAVAKKPAAKTPEEAARRQREVEQRLGQEALKQLEDVALSLPELELSVYDRTPRNLKELMQEAPELTEEFVKAGGLKEYRGCRHSFRAFVERQFQPERLIRERGWNREALRRFWHKLSFADCHHEQDAGGH